MDCLFQSTAKPNVYRCLRCGFVVTTARFRPDQIHKACAGRPERSTPWGFLLAFLRHALNLFRRRTPWEIVELHAICRGCDYYRPSKRQSTRSWWQRLLRIEPAEGACGKCGCAVDRRGTWLNKLAWRSEKCPEGKWPATSIWRLFYRWLGRQG